MKLSRITIYFLIITSLVLIIGLSGCKTNVIVDTNKINDEAQCRNQNGPYFWLSGKCCLDSNSDGICDQDAGSRSCSDDCSLPGCMENEQFRPYDCVVGEDGCLQRKVLDFQINRCNVECLNDNGCRRNERCVNYKCEEIICGDGLCDPTEDCTCSDCINEDQVCCSGDVYAGECCLDDDCNEDETCGENKCALAPYCGDGICSSDENCNNCDLDCLNEGEICCDNTATLGVCCTNENCGGNEACTDNICTIIEQTTEENNNT